MSRQGRVLVIDDDPGTCQTIGDVLELRRHVVESANGGQAALAALVRQAVDVVILDVRLPDMSGLDLLRSIRATAPSTEVIIITGHASLPSATQAIEDAAFAYMTKPIDMDHLLAIVDKALEKQRLERALRESEERYRLVAEHIQDAILLLDLEGRVTFTNRRGEELAGYSSSELWGRPISSLLTPEGAAEAATRIEAARDNRDVAPFFETELIRRDGSRIWVEANVARVVKDGRESGRLAVVRDITARRHTEASLLDTSRTLQAVIDAAPVGIVAIDTEGRVLVWNKAATRLLGWTEEEVLGQQLPTIPDERRAEFENGRARNLRGEATRHETQRRHKDGSLVDVISSMAPLSGADGTFTGTLGILEDITERNRFEEQLRQAAKMEGIGQLAGGVAHDFNNLLTVIGGRTFLLMSRLPADHPVQRDLQLIQQTGERAATLTRQLLAFSRKQTLEPTVLDLNGVVSQMKSLLERLLGEDVDLVIALHPGLGRAKADLGQIEQVIVNLAVNARDAMPHGGRLTIETHDTVLDEAYARQHVDVPPGAYVCLAVSDTGIGMDEETRARIFEPFFTTKAAGKGTGLGLSMVYGIVKQSNGHITVYSEPGFGTIFRIFLPQTGGKAAPTEQAEREAPRPGTGTVLIAEDDLGLRALTREILELQGYSVLEAQDVEDAVRVAERHRGTIDLLITDVVMPRMSGRALADAVLRRRPDIKVLFMSGYPDNALAPHAVPSAGVHFLQKPFTPATLGRKVREALG